MAANREKGEVDFTVDGKTYTLRLTWNEIAKFESVQGVAWFVDFAPKLQRLNTISGTEWISLLWAALQRHHESLSLFDAGELLTAAGVEQVAVKLSECLEFTFPTPEPAKNPPKASPKRGTGK